MNPTTRRRFLQYAGAAAVTAAAPSIAHAQDYPYKPIKIVVGFSAGGTTDALPRLLSEPMGQRLGQPIVVENKPGAAGNIATVSVARSPADGYTLLASSVGQMAVSPYTMNMPIDPITDFAHISMIGEGDQFLTINTKVPAVNYAEFLALAKSKPHSMFYGDSGAGGNMNLYIEYFKLLAGVDIDAVHFKGGSQVLPDLIANRVQMSLLSNIVLGAHAKEGQLRPILLYGKKRDPNYPDVPTVAEVGLPKLESASNWFGLHAPIGTPNAVIQKIRHALVESLQLDEVKAGLATLGIRPGGDTSEHFTARIKREAAIFKEVVIKTGIKTS